VIEHAACCYNGRAGAPARLKAGNIPLPGVSVVAANTLTGQRYATITDINGNYSMTIPANGRYVLRLNWRAFGPETKVVLIKSTPGPTAVPPANQQADFALTLASGSRPKPRRRTSPVPRPPASARRPHCGAMPASRTPKSRLAGTNSRVPKIPGSAPGPTAQPSLRLPITPISPPTPSPSPVRQAPPNPFAGVDMEQLRQNAELDQSLSGGGQGGPAGGRGQGGGPWRRKSGSGGGFGGGGGRFRRAEVVSVVVAAAVAAVAAEEAASATSSNFKPNQPHGSFFWTGGNSALNATPFPVRAQREPQPSYAQNQFGLTFMGAPYIPHLIEHDTKDVIFFNASGQAVLVALQPVRHRAHRR